MKVPSLCPCCRQPMVNESVPTVGIAYWRKHCHKRIDHTINITTVPGHDDDIKRLSLIVKDGVIITWEPENKRCWISRTWDLEWRYELPYWEPDLSNYPKLINKIKIYLLFS